MTSTSKIALVTGASRGLGLATAEALARQSYHTIFVARSLEALEPTLALLKNKNFSVSAFTADVAKDEDVQNLFREVSKHYDRLDILVNNAGVFRDDRAGRNPSLSNVSPTLVMETLQTNTLGPYRMIQTFLPLMKKHGGNIVNVSSGMGALTDMDGGYPAYRISKTALNAVTRVASEELREFGIRVNSVCPGWVKTDMGGPGAEREVSEGIQGILWAATLPADGPSGGFYRDGKPIEW